MSLTKILGCSVFSEKQVIQTSLKFPSFHIVFEVLNIHSDKFALGANKICQKRKKSLFDFNVPCLRATQEQLTSKVNVTTEKLALRRARMQMKTFNFSTISSLNS